jgi:hypothetical protein
MVTLDLSEKIDPEALQKPKEWIDRKFKEEIDEGDAKVIFHLFLDKEFSLTGPHGKFSIQFNEESLKRNTLFFDRALGFIEEVYELIRSRTGNRPLVDFELCLAGVPFPTSPENHFFFNLELSHRGVRIQSFAPRFVGKFHKGIDLQRNREDFRKQFYQHVLIAHEEGDYKISIRSGGGEHSVLPRIGELSKGGLHLKTDGTSWLEAIRLIALMSPALYREMHQFALSVFQEAIRSYSVTTDLDQIPKVEELNNEDLPDLLDKDDSRQLFYITYEYLLNAKNDAGGSLFKDRLYPILTRYEEDYWALIERQIEKHLHSLGVKKRNEMKRQ